MTPVYIMKLGFTIQKIDVNIQKIYGSALVIYRIVIVGFLVQNKLKQV